MASPACTWAPEGAAFGTLDAQAEIIKLVNRMLLASTSFCEYFCFMGMPDPEFCYYVTVDHATAD